MEFVPRSNWDLVLLNPTDQPFFKCVHVLLRAFIPPLNKPFVSCQLIFQLFTNLLLLIYEVTRSLSDHLTSSLSLSLSLSVLLFLLTFIPPSFLFVSLLLFQPNCYSFMMFVSYRNKTDV